MPPRTDGTPRRGQEPRRGASADQSPADAPGRDDERTRGFGGIGDARAYTPRGRTVREGDQRTRAPRTGRTADPFRPALQVLDGGQPVRDRRRADPAGPVDDDHGRDAGDGRPDDHRDDDHRDDHRDGRRAGPGSDRRRADHDRTGDRSRGNDRRATDRRDDSHRDDPRVDGHRDDDPRDDSHREDSRRDDTYRDDGYRDDRRRADLGYDGGSDRRRGSDRRVSRTDDQHPGREDTPRRRSSDVSDRRATDVSARRRSQDEGDRRRARARVTADRADRAGDNEQYDDAADEPRRPGSRVEPRRAARSAAGGTDRTRRGTEADEPRRAPVRGENRRDDERQPVQRRSRDRQDKLGRYRDDQDEWDETPRRGGRATAGATRSRSTASPRRGVAATRTEAGTRTGRERRVAVPPGPRRTSGGRPAQAAAAARPGARRPLAVIAAEPPRLANGTRRLRLGTVLALTLFVAIGVRLVVLQVGDSAADANSLDELRRSRLTEVVLPAPRGSILDSDGAVLAHSVEARYIYADPEMVTDPVAAAAKLSPVLGIPASKLIQLMAKKKRPGGGNSQFEYLARGVDTTVSDSIAAMKIPGISSGRDERRDIPGADLAANLIGFTGDDHTGLEGLEARYDDLLRGTDGKRIFETGLGDLAAEIPGGYHRETAASPGSSIQLTINRDLQFEVQRALSQQGEKSNATVAAAVVMNAKTGEVVAQASYPAYNAAKPEDFKPKDRDDVATSVIADPGSTHKAFTIGAAMEEGVVTKDSLITVGPALTRGGYDFVDGHRQEAGTRLTIPGVLAYSSNVGTIRIADKLGKDKLYEYQQKFGLGRPTNEGMPGEATGRLLAPDEWSGSASGSVPIGMSVDATLIQMTAGYGAIANDGVYTQPHLIKATISGKNGKVTPSPVPETHRVLSAETARQLREMMESVVDVQGATGTKAAVDGYRVAGKTGTGKMLVEGQYTKHNAGSFIGMAPAEDPQFVIGVFADVPDGTGGDVAAPAFSKMMSSALRHYRVPPSGNPEPTFKLKG